MWWRRHADYARADIRSRQDTVIYFIIYFLSKGDGSSHRGSTAASSRFSEARRPAPAGRKRRNPRSRRPIPCAPDSPTGAVSTKHLVVVRRQRIQSGEPDPRTMSLNADELSRRSCN